MTKNIFKIVLEGDMETLEMKDIPDYALVKADKEKLNSLGIEIIESKMFIGEVDIDKELLNAIVKTLVESVFKEVTKNYDYDIGIFPLISVYKEEKQGGFDFIAVAHGFKHVKRTSSDESI